MTTRITLLRTGQADAPLSFMGTLIRELSTREAGMQDRWYELAAYEAQAAGGSRYVVAVGYRSERPHEIPLDWAGWGLPARHLAKFLTDFAVTHDIEVYVLGIPGGDQFEGKREQVVRSLRTHLMAACAELLGSIPGAVEEL